MTDNDITNTAKHTLGLGSKYPYDLNRKQKDWAHRAARGVIADLQDRAGIKHELSGVDTKVREDIIDMLSEIIRVAHAERPPEVDSDAKECPHHLYAMLTLQMAAKRDGASVEKLKEIETIGYCSKSDCAMWEPEYEEESMTISESDETPKGWHERPNAPECSKHKYVGVIGKSRIVFKQTKSNKGDCGLKSKENGCFYPG